MVNQSQPHKELRSKSRLCDDQSLAANLLVILWEEGVKEFRSLWLKEHGDLIGADGVFAAGPKSFLFELAEFSGAAVLDAIVLMRRASSESEARSGVSYPPSVGAFVRLCKQADKRLKMLVRKPVDEGVYLSKAENLKRLQEMRDRLGL